MSFWSWYHDNGIIPNLWKGFTGQLSAEKQNSQNLDFQREQLDYQKQLNQIQMEREDTAFQRQAQDAQAVGINPMALAGGSGAQGSPLSSTSFSGSSLQGSSPADGLSVITNLIGGISRLKSDSSERDLLNAERDKQNLENAINAYDAGFTKDENGNWIPSDSAKRNQRFWDNLNERMQTLEEKNKGYQNRNELASAERNERVNEFQEKSGLNDETTSLVKSLRDLEKLFLDGSDEKTKPKIQSMFKKLFDSIKELNEKNISEFEDRARESIYSDPERGKNIKKNQARYYNRMIRNLYEQGNSK